MTKRRPFCKCALMLSCYNWPEATLTLVYKHQEEDKTDRFPECSVFWALTRAEWKHMFSFMSSGIDLVTVWKAPEAWFNQFSVVDVSALVQPVKVWKVWPGSAPGQHSLLPLRSCGERGGQVRTQLDADWRRVVFLLCWLQLSWWRSWSSSCLWKCCSGSQVTQQPGIFHNTRFLFSASYFQLLIAAW